jgi:hypothetical protein
VILVKMLFIHGFHSPFSSIELPWATASERRMRQ